MANRRKEIPSFFSIEVGRVRGIAESMDDAEWGRWSKRALDDLSMGCVRKDVDPVVRELYDRSKDNMDKEFQRKKEWYEKKKSMAYGAIREDAQPVDGRATAKPSRTTPPQNSYGEFQNVRMTTAEFEKLVQAEGAERANALIEELSSYLASSGKRYKSHYATLLNWARRKDKEGEPKRKFLTADEISRRNIEESKRQLDALMAHRSVAHG